MWSVVHFPTAFSSTQPRVRSVPSHAANGSSSSRRSESGFTTTRRSPRRRPAARNPDSPGSKPLAGSSSADGAPRTGRPQPSARRIGSCTKSWSRRPVERHRDDGLGRPDEREWSRRCRRCGEEVAVERRHDRVAVALLDVVTLPLPDARPARVGEHGGADGLEVGEQAVALDGGAHLLGARRDQQRRFRP